MTKHISADEIDCRFDAGEDVTEYFDMERAEIKEPHQLPKPHRVDEITPEQYRAQLEANPEKTAILLDKLRNMLVETEGIRDPEHPQYAFSDSIRQSLVFAQAAAEGLIPDDSVVFNTREEIDAHLRQIIDESQAESDGPMPWEESIADVLCEFLGWKRYVDFYPGLYESAPRSRK